MPKTKQAKSFTYPSLTFSQRGGQAPTLMTFVAPVSDVLLWAEIGVLGQDEDGFQREKGEAKVRGVARFLSADDRNTIPTAVVVAFRVGRAKYTEDSSGTCGRLILKFDDGYVGNVVDGQHRLYGMNAIDPRMPVAIVGLLDADEMEKAFQFLVINNKASRVTAKHAKSVLAKWGETGLAGRLKSARLAFDADGIRDIDLVNSSEDSPFYQSIDWTATLPKKQRIVQATAIEMSLDYIAGLGIPDFQDRDVRRNVFLTVWKVIRSKWTSDWKKDSRLLSKVGVYCLTKFVMDLIVSWADSEELSITISNLEHIEQKTAAIVKYLDRRFWSVPWADRAQGGFDTAQGRERVVAAIRQLYRNGRQKIEWYSDIEILDSSAAKRS